MNNTPTNNFEKNNFQQLNQTAQKASNALATQNGAQRFEEAYSKCGEPMAKCISVPEQQYQSNSTREELRHNVLREISHFPSHAGRILEQWGDIGINPNLQNFDVIYINEHGYTKQIVDPKVFLGLTAQTTQSISIQTRHIDGKKGVDIIVNNIYGRQETLHFLPK